MVRHFEEELKNLNKFLIKMADIVNNNITKSIDAYLTHKAPGEVYVNDDLVDQYERIIEEHCLDIILREHPVARDLRVVSGILKLITDLERIGDHAEDILEFNDKLNMEDYYQIDDIDNMANLASEMIVKSIEAFVKEDSSLAEEVIKDDDIVDELYLKILNELIELDNNNITTSEFIIYTTLIVKYIERIADHAVNVAEWVIFIISGFHKNKKNDTK